MVTLVYRATLIGLIGAAFFAIGPVTHAEDGVFTPTSLVANEVGTADSKDGALFTPASLDGPQFFFTAEALWLQLDDGTRDARPIASDIFTDRPLLTTHDLNYNTAAGPRLGFGWYLNDVSSVEATYFGLNHWNASTNAEVVYPIGPIILGDETNARAIADLNSAEVNYFHSIGDSDFQILNGFRYLNFGETFSFARDFAPYYLVRERSVLGYDQYRKTQNYLFGWQTGARYITAYGPLQVGLTGKVGVYGNSYSAHKTTGLDLFDTSIPIVDRSSRGTHAAFIGELGLNGVYQISNYWSFSAGYNLLWVDGIARAANQFHEGDWRDPDQAVAFSQGAFLHGANIGLNFNW